MLEGKRILITGGAGFIATTLARELVDGNEIVAIDNLHRDALSGTELAEPPELHAPPVRRPRRRAAQGARARRDPLRPLRGDRRRRDRAREPGAHDARERDRHLQRARGGARDHRHARALRRLLDERGLRHPRLQRQRGPGLDDRLGRRGALDLRGLEARRRAHGARLPRRAEAPDRHRASVQRLRPRPDRRRRDPRVHRGGARRRRPDRPRRRLADPRLVLRHRHGQRRPRVPRAARGGRPGVQHRQPALVGHDLRPRAADQAAHRRARARSSSRRSATSTSSCASRTSRRRASCSAGSRGSSSTTA